MTCLIANKESSYYYTTVCIICTIKYIFVLNLAFKKLVNNIYDKKRTRINLAPHFATMLSKRRHV